MTQKILVLIVSTFTLLPLTVKAQEPTSKSAGHAKFNRVYVKIIMPTDSADRDKDRLVVESWIAEELKKRGQAKFTAVTAWVSLDLGPFDATDVWDGKLGDRQYCPVGADIPERAKGRIKVLLSGWGPAGGHVTVSMKDEPGRRALAAVEEHKSKLGMPYVAVLIAPPSEKPAARADDEK